MTNQSYLDTITEQSQEKFNLMKERMLEPIKQVQQARQKNLRNLLTEIEKKQSTLQEKKVSLEKLCQAQQHYFKELKKFWNKIII